MRTTLTIGFLCAISVCASPIVMPDGLAIYTNKTEYIAYLVAAESTVTYVHSELGYLGTDHVMPEFYAPVSIYERDTVVNLVNCGDDNPQPPPQCFMNGLYGNVTGDVWTDHIFTAAPGDLITNNVKAAYTDMFTPYMPYGPYGMGMDISVSASASVTIEFGYDRYVLPSRYTGFFGVVRPSSTSQLPVGFAFTNATSDGTDISISNIFLAGTPVPEPVTSFLVLTGALLVLLPSWKRRLK